MVYYKLNKGKKELLVCLVLILSLIGVPFIQSDLEGFQRHIFSSVETSMDAENNKTKSWAMQTDIHRINNGLQNRRVSNTTGQTTSYSDSGRQFLFMHVGKTGGKTLRTILHMSCSIKGNKNARKECAQNFKNTTESEFSKHVRGIVHYKDHWGVSIEQATDVLFSIREPIGRFESWFGHRNPFHCKKCTEKRLAIMKAQKNPNAFSKRFFQDCFVTVDQMARGLNPNDSTLNTSLMIINRTDCYMLLQNAFKKVGMSEYGHLSAGYRFYRQKASMHRPTIFRNKKVWVARTEYLWQDAENIDKELGGTGAFGKFAGAKMTHGSEHYADKTGIHPSNVFRVCCALQPEIGAYRDIVDRAVNLNPTEKIQTYQMTWNRCNVSSWEMLETKCAQMALTTTGP